DAMPGGYLLHDEFVAARYRLQELRSRGVCLDLASQPVHELLEKLPVAGASMSPDMRQQPIRAHGATRTGEQHLQQAQLQLGEPDYRSIADLHGMLIHVQRYAPGGERAGAFEP